MLVLSTHPGDCIDIEIAGRKCTIQQVASESGSKTRLSFEAPPEVVIMRRNAVNKQATAKAPAAGRVRP